MNSFSELVCIQNKCAYSLGGCIKMEKCGSYIDKINAQAMYPCLNRKDQESKNIQHEWYIC